MVLAGVVYCAPHASLSATEKKAQKQGKSRPKTSASPQTPPATGALPAPVEEMRQAILDAVQSGRLADLRVAIELNELKPDIAAAPNEDPIKTFERLSGDGTGADILRILGLLFDASPAILPLGRDLENNRLYVWPGFAEKPLAEWTASDKALAEQLEPAAGVARQHSEGRYLGWRLVIGADGTWHTFRKIDDPAKPK
jgi:hypothetical protein